MSELFAHESMKQTFDNLKLGDAPIRTGIAVDRQRQNRGDDREVIWSAETYDGLLALK